MPKPSHEMPIELAREIVRQGEVRLGALMSLATAADLRATTLCGIFGAASVGTGAAVLVDLTSENPSWPLIAAGGVLGAGLFFAALLAAISGAPRDFYIGGGDPSSLRPYLWDGFKWKDERLMLEATASRYGKSIENDKEILKSGTARVTLALWVAFASPFLGTAVYFISSRYPF